MKTTIKEGRFVTPYGDVITGTLSIEDGRISDLSGAGSGQDSEEVIEAAGLTIFPGFIDVHNHQNGTMAADKLDKLVR